MGYVTGSTRASDAGGPRPAPADPRGPGADAVEGPDPARDPVPPEAPLDRLFSALCGDVLLRHASGQRVLDLGYGAPEVTAWMRRRSGRHLSIVEREVLENAASGVSLSEYPDASFDLVYCLVHFAHLGWDAESSETFARGVLAEASRVLEPGGIMAVELSNPRSLHGLQEGIRNPITVVSSKKRVSDRGGYVTRWETAGKLRDIAPDDLRLHGVHGLGVFVPYRRMLDLPLVGGALRRLEWWARDRPVLQHFGRNLLVLLRKQVLPTARSHDPSAAMAHGRIAALGLQTEAEPKWPIDPNASSSHFGAPAEPQSQEAYEIDPETDED